MWGGERSWRVALVFARVEFSEHWFGLGCIIVKDGRTDGWVHGGSWENMMCI